MATTEPYFSLVKTGASSWATVLVHRDEPLSATEKLTAPSAGASSQSFESATGTQEESSERLPRLAIAMVTFLIFAVSLSAEIEYLRQSGFSLR